MFLSVRYCPLSIPESFVRLIFTDSCVVVMGNRQANRNKAFLVSFCGQYSKGPFPLKQLSHINNSKSFSAENPNPENYSTAIRIDLRQVRLILDYIF